jgi:peptidoglycan hydrolase-like protein with peptidoglycan-binding domain
MSILKSGMKGAPIRRLQAKLGVTADGDFGPGTRQAVMDYQKANGLAVDGIAGPDTFAAMGLQELILLRVGSRGDQVKTLQKALGAGADGIFGQGTKKAVMDFQKAQGIAADGMAGPETLARMPEFPDINDDVLARAKMTSEDKAFDGEGLPEISGSEAVAGSASEAAPEESLWGKVTGWFS